MNQKQALAIGWKIRYKSDCFIEPNGNAHLVTIKKPKTSEKVRETAKTYAFTHKIEIKQNKDRRLKNHPQEVMEYNEKYNHEHYDCIRRAERLQNNAYYKRNPAVVIDSNKKSIDKKIKQGYSKTCASGHHNRCKKTKLGCKCPKCHKNT